MDAIAKENFEMIEQALKYSREHLGNSKISVEDVAMHAGFSTNYFNRIFMAHTGFSVMEYIRFERLRQAAFALRSTDRDILEIALVYGYTTHEGFIRSFRKQYGCTPSEYRERKKQIALNWRDLADETLAHRFLAKHSSFRILEADELIDSLLSKDARRYGYLCTSIAGMGLQAVTDRNSWEEGFVLVGDKRNAENDYYITLVTDDRDILKDWLTNLEHIETIQTLAEDALPANAKECREYMYLSAEMEAELPDHLEIHRLTPADAEQIRLWAGDKKDGYTQHLLHLEDCFRDPNVLEFGLFEKERSNPPKDNKSDCRMIAAAGCGIEQVHGFTLNDCIQIRFMPGKENDHLYRSVFAYITNEILRMGVIPFDNIQYGDYADGHGGFTSEAMGYHLVNRLWFIETTC